LPARTHPPQNGDRRFHLAALDDEPAILLASLGNEHVRPSRELTVDKVSGGNFLSHLRRIHRVDPSEGRERMRNVFQRLAHLGRSQRVGWSPDDLDVNYCGCGGQREILNLSLRSAFHSPLPPANGYPARSRTWSQAY